MSELSKNGTEIMSKGYKQQRYKQYLFVIHELTSRELKRRYARSYLGVVWSLLNPLLMMAVTTFVFSYMFSKSIENYPVYYLIGTTIYALFHTATEHSMTTLVDNKNLLFKAKLPKYTFVLSRLCTALVNYVYSLITLGVIMFLFKIRVTWTMLLIIPVILLVFMLSIGIGFILSIVYVFFADIKYLYGVFCRLLVFCSAIFYPLSSLPLEAQKILGFNPIFLAINIARNVLQYGKAGSEEEWLKLITFSLGFFICGLLIFKKFEGNVMRKI